MHISIIGSGNVAWHIAQAAMQAGHCIDSISSRTAEHAQVLANAVGSVCCSIAEVPTDSDAYIIAVSDNAIAQVVAQLPKQLEGVVMHTSGATHISVLAAFANYGVLYPCQTISQSVAINYAQLPFLTEGNNEESALVVKNFAQSISSQVSVATSEQRCYLHVAAVMSSNFSNHLLWFTQQYMQEHGLDFGLLRPLMEQTIYKAFSTDPYSAQTGPARRHDEATIATHKQLISNKNMLSIYNLMTQSIENTYNK